MRRLGPAWLAGIMLGLAAEWVGFGGTIRPLDP